MAESSCKVLLGMSGGVDSSVAAYQLKRDGYQVVAVTLRFHEGERAKEKLLQAQRIASQLDIEHHVVDAEQRFDELVKQHVSDELRSGREPNPCTVCSRELKLPLLFEAADEFGCEKVATGHYARITQEDWGPHLLPYQLRRPLDQSKDQTYLLYTLTQEMMSRLIFPLDDIHKGEVRRTAMRAGLMPIVPVNDGQGEPCFFEGASAASWFDDHEDDRMPSGPVVNIDTREVVGSHEGLHRHDIGQRMGDGFVVAKDVQESTLYVGPEPLSKRESCLVRDVVWTSVKEPEKKRSCRVRTQDGLKPVPAQIVCTDEGTIVAFNERVANVHIGQPVVFYSDDLVLGGGIVIC